MRSLVAIIFLAGSGSCFANIVPISIVPTDVVPTSGAGYGHVLTLLNAHNSSGRHSDGIEANCDVINSSGNVVGSCTGPFSAMPGGLNDGANENHAQPIGDTGITNASHAAEQLLLIFNISQQGNAQTINLLDIGLALWYNNTLIFSALSSRTDTYSQPQQGNGKAGFGYGLDSGAAAAAQSAINSARSGGATLDTILVTGAFRAGCLSGQGCANGGAESLFLGAHVTAVPDGGLTAILLSVGFVAIETLRRKLRA
jgi:hypothetical protein